MVATALVGLTGFVLTAVLVVLATAGTVWLAKVRPAVEHDPDTRFWYIFAGLCVLLPAVLVTAVLNRWAGAAAALLAVGTWWLANAVVGRRIATQSDAAAQQLADAEREALRSRHRTVLERWGRYELDPARAIDFPAMTDVRVPEISALAKALARADWLRRNPDSGVAGVTRTSRYSTGEYRMAVALLEDSFQAAELAAGKTAHHTPNRSTALAPLHISSQASTGQIPGQLPGYHLASHGPCHRRDVVSPIPNER